jgi:Lrp/AsnC family transcriptional regulator for asnA, asnC and gidA
MKSTNNMPIIDQLDEQILNQLLQDGRKSFVEIGKECNTPYETIIKRYKEMKKQGIIIGATNQINYRFYGIRYMGTIAIDTGEEDVEKLKKYLNTIPNVGSILTSYKKYSLTAILYLTTVQEFEEIKEKIRRYSSITTLGINSNLWVDIKNIPENLFLECPGQIKEADNNGKRAEEFIEFDDIDIQLIDSLSKNARRPFSKIAQEIGTSVDTVIRRYERLKRKKVIKVVIQIDPRKVGFQANASFYISIQSQGTVDAVVSSLSKMRYVYLITKIMGEADLFVLGAVKDFNDFFTLRDQIAKLPFTRIIGAEIIDAPTVFPGPSLHMSTF